jgi:hypothetical protein
MIQLLAVNEEPKLHELNSIELLLPELVLEVLVGWMTVQIMVFVEEPALCAAGRRRQ